MAIHAECTKQDFLEFSKSLIYMVFLIRRILAQPLH
jgi:hypothetical protein